MLDGLLANYKNNNDSTCNSDREQPESIHVNIDTKYNSKSTKIIETIKEVLDEEDSESPALKKRSVPNSKSGKQTDLSLKVIDNKTGYTETDPPLASSGRLAENWNETNESEEKRESKSVEGNRQKYVFKKSNETGTINSKKGSTTSNSNTASMIHKRINMDIFSVTPGRKTIDKPRNSAGGLPMKKQGSASNLHSAKVGIPKKELYASYSFKSESQPKTPMSNHDDIKDLYH